MMMFISLAQPPEQRAESEAGRIRRGQVPGRDLRPGEPDLRVDVRDRPAARYVRRHRALLLEVVDQSPQPVQVRLVTRPQGRVVDGLRGQKVVAVTKRYHRLQHP
jgi:hypothetical protein